MFTVPIQSTLLTHPNVMLVAEEDADDNDHYHDDNIKEKDNDIILEAMYVCIICTIIHQVYSS